MKRLVVLSGKGGAGKSTISSSIAYLISDKLSLVCADCDVDTPNLHIVLGFNKRNSEQISTQEVAEVVASVETNIDCNSICPYGAIDKKDGKYKIDQMLCEGCGACMYKCPKGMIRLKKIVNGLLLEGKTRYGFPLVYCQLEIGKGGSGELVSKIKDKALQYPADIMLIDSAAGIGCPVIASVKDADAAIVVVEPTNSSFSDMIRSIELLDLFGIKKAVVINRHDLNLEISNKIVNFCKSNNIPILSKIPFDKRVVDSLMRLKPVVELYNNFVQYFNPIVDFVLSELF